MARWNILSKDTQTSIEGLYETLLRNRGHLESSQQEHFLHPTHPREIDFFELGINPQEVATSIELLQEALEKQHSVVVYGDYDADGICATTIVWQTLSTLGLNIMPFIPEREAHGYGLSEAGIAACMQKHNPQLLITVDNGIVAHEALEYAASVGCKVIVTDHHTPDENKPNSAALIHTTQLCGATVAWGWLSELLKTMGTQQAREAHEHSLELCALATIADMVPLTGANRSFAKHGLFQLRKTTRPGLRSLFESARCSQETVSAGQLSFQIAPAINAAGRMSTGMDALRLLCTNSEAAASKLAAQLVSLNVSRRDATQQGMQLAREQLLKQEEQSILIACVPDVHEGVVGLVAGKLVEQFHKPVLVLTRSGDILKGSARSIKGVNVTQLLRSVSDQALSVGGHAAAAGISIAPEFLESVTKRLQERALEEIDPALFEKELKIDCSISHELLRIETVEALKALAPFGIGNPAPVLAIENLQLLSKQPLGKESKHLKLQVSSKLGKLPVLLWSSWKRYGSQLLEGESYSIAGSLEINEWKGRRTLQILGKEVLV